MHNAHQADVIFGLSPVLFAGSLFVLTYLLIITELPLNKELVVLS